MMSKHLYRFARRLSKHGISNCVFPPFIEPGRVSYKVTVGKRAVHVFDDGSAVPALVRSNDCMDYEAFTTQRHRMHAIYLAMTASARKRGEKSHARALINVAIEERLATEERLHHERS